MIKRTHFLSLYSSYLLRCPHSQYTKYYSLGRLAYNYSKAK